MTTDELNALAHQIAYDCARSDIESFTRIVDDRGPPPTPIRWSPEYIWYDLTTIIRDEFEREAVARAIFYLDARSLLHRKPAAPFLVQILPPLSSGALVPPTVAEALSA